MQHRGQAPPPWDVPAERDVGCTQGHLATCLAAGSYRHAGPIAAPLGCLPWWELGWLCPGAVLLLWLRFCWTWGSPRAPWSRRARHTARVPLLRPPGWTQSGVHTGRAGVRRAAFPVPNTPKTRGIT